MKASLCPKKTIRTWALWAAKAALTALLLWFAVRKVPLPELWAALHRVQPMWAFGGSFLYAGLLVIIEPLRFAYAGRMVHAIQPSRRRWIGLFLESRAFMYALPASAGSDGIIWLRLRHMGWEHAHCAQVLLITRFLGVGIWALAAAFALAASPSVAALLLKTPAVLQYPGTWATLSAGVLGTVAFAPWVWKRLGRPPMRPTSLPNLLMAVLLATLSALANAGGVMVAGAAVGIPVRLELALGLMAFFNFAMIMPISLGGFGLQEALFLALLSPLGLPGSTLLVCSALVHAQRLILTLTGAGIFLFARSSVDPEAKVVPGLGHI